MQPYAALARHAIKRGHSAVICTGKSFKNFIVEKGIEFKEAESDLMAMLDTEDGKIIFSSALAHPLKTKKFLNDVVNPAFRKTLDQFWQSAQGADVIIYHPKAFGAPDMADALKIPCISMPPVPVTYPIGEFPNPIFSSTKNFGKALNKLTYVLMAKAEVASIVQVNDFREKMLKLPKRKSGLYTFKIGEKRIPIIYPVSPSLFANVDSWKGSVYLPGFFYLDTGEEQLDEELKNFIESGPAPIIISFGSMPLKAPSKFKDKIIEAIKTTNNRAVILTGNTGMSFANEKTIYAVNSAPHTLLFPLAKGIVHHGGAGTTAAALISGKPQMVIPFGADQPFWAQLLYKKSCCVKPIKEKEISAQVLARRFLEMGAERYINTAKELRETICKENGVDNAVRYIEHLCEKQH